MHEFEVDTVIVVVTVHIAMYNGIAFLEIANEIQKLDGDAVQCMVCSKQ